MAAFYLDHDVNVVLAELLRPRVHTATTARYQIERRFNRGKDLAIIVPLLDESKPRMIESRFLALYGTAASPELRTFVVGRGWIAVVSWQIVRKGSGIRTSNLTVALGRNLAASPTQRNSQIAGNT